MDQMTEVLKYAEVHPKNAGKLAQKLHIKKDEISLVRKFHISEKDSLESNEDERSIIAVVSSEDRDRDGQIVKIDGADLKDYENNPILMWAHRYGEPPIGRMMWYKKTSGKLIMKFQFAKTEFAEQIYQLFKDKILRAFSIGFTHNPDDYDAKEKTFKKISILEVSAVPVPANQNALVMEAYQKGIIKSPILRKDFQIDIVQEEKPEDILASDITDEITQKYEDDDIQTTLITADEIRGAMDASQESDISEIAETVVLDEQREREDQAIEEARQGNDHVHNLEDGEAYDFSATEIITKPETTDNYHRIPVSTGHDDHKIRTITVSDSKGIKALYCVDCKVITTYLFSTDKWTMEEAQAWVKEHEKSDESDDAENKFVPAYLSKVFDVENVESQPSTFEYALLEKFLECKTSQIFKNSYFVRYPLMGNRLYGFKHVLSDFVLKDTRNFQWNSGKESPPNYEVIQLSSTQSDDFLVDGIQFYDAKNIPLAFRVEPVFMGIDISLITSLKYKSFNKALAEKAFQYAKTNNALKLEKFALSGEFLPNSDDDWKNLILEQIDKQAIITTVNQLENKKEKAKSRGMLFVGRPGTGKTKTGRVIINEIDSTFIWVSSKDFKRGDANGAITLAFDMARELAPSVLFLEDIDTWLTSYCVDLLKTELDGIRQNTGVVTILTSNFPERLPDALLDRPGRFHHVLDFKLPAMAQRKTMIESWAGEVSEDLLTQILKATDGYSGAHMKELIEYAQMLVEDDEKELGEAILESLKRMQDQKELIEHIRDSKKDDGIKNFMAKIKGLQISDDIDIEFDDPDVEIEIESTIEEPDTKDTEIEIESDTDKDLILFEDDDEVEKAETGETNEQDTETKETYFCECIECGWKTESERHCRDFKCEKCGGEMRRIERPGPGKSLNDAIWEAEHEPDDKADIAELLSMIKELKAEVAEIKEGRVLSSKNRTLIKTVIEAIESALPELKALLEATEPSNMPKDVEIEIEGSTIDDIPTKNELPTDKILGLIEQKLAEVLNPDAVKRMSDESITNALARIRGKVM